MLTLILLVNKFIILVICMFGIYLFTSLNQSDLHIMPEIYKQYSLKTLDIKIVFNSIKDINIKIINLIF